MTHSPSSAKVPAMRVQLTKDFQFEAAQTLPNAPEGHKCRRMHGHSFRVEISVEGEVDPASGWFYDHAEIGAAMKPLLQRLDQSLHRFMLWLVRWADHDLARHMTMELTQNNISNFASHSWQYRVVPVAVKFLSLDTNGGEVLIRDFDACRIPVLVQFGLDR